MTNSADLVLEKLRSHFAKKPYGAKKSFCEESEIHSQNLKNWLAGTKIPLESLDAIATGLHCKPWDLLAPNGFELVDRAELRKAASKSIATEDELRAALASTQRALTGALVRIEELEKETKDFSKQEREMLSDAIESIRNQRPSLAPTPTRKLKGQP